MPAATSSKAKKATSKPAANAAVPVEITDRAAEKPAKIKTTRAKKAAIEPQNAPTCV